MDKDKLKLGKIVYSPDYRSKPGFSVWEVIPKPPKTKVKHERTN